MRGAEVATGKQVISGEGESNAKGIQVHQVMTRERSAFRKQKEKAQDPWETSEDSKRFPKTSNKIRDTTNKDNVMSPWELWLREMNYSQTASPVRVDEI